MDKALLKQALAKLLGGFVLCGALLFVPAGTLAYWNGWLFMLLLFIPMLVLGVLLLKKAPGLLKKRLSTDERETEQKYVILLSIFMFVGGFVVAGLDYRFGWSRLPLWAVVAASVIFLGSYGLYAQVMRENAYLSRVVEIQKDQQVVDTGLYGIVRHPMYFATVLLFLSLPIVLGSVYALAIFLIYPFLLVKRIKNEEQVLRAGLPGYEEYMKKVKYRMLPFIW